MYELSSKHPTAEPAVAAEREQYWRDQLSRWQQSGLSKVAYCRQESLSIYKLKYWCRKLLPETLARRKTSRRAFVPVQVASVPVAASLTLSLPNGMQVGGISEQNVAVVKHLLEQL